MDFTVEDLADMHLMYGLAQGNIHEVRRLYLERFPNRHLSSHPTFASVDRRLREFRLIRYLQFLYRPFAICTYARNRRVRIGQISRDTLLSTSTRAMAAKISVSPATVWRVLREERIQPFRL